MKFPPKTWDQPPHNRKAFQSVASFLNTAPVQKSLPPSSPASSGRPDVAPIIDHPLEAGEDGLLELSDLDLTNFLTKTHTNAFIVLHKGKLIAEHYFGTMRPESLHLSQSVAKSFTGAMAGILTHQGLLNPNALISDYLPDLALTAYAGATIQHLLDMTTGVAFDENYTNPYSDIGRVDVASGWKPIPKNATPDFTWPKTMWDLILTLKTKSRPHGEQFTYRSIETDVLAFILERVSNKRLPQLLSDLIWQKAGMAQNANYTIDPSDFAIADGGLSACARDYVKFGQLILDGGQGIIPADWIEQTRNGPCGNLTGEYASLLPHGGYHNQFWIEDPEHRSLVARGVFGQLIYISWVHNLVVVKLSAWPKFVDVAMEAETLRLCHKIGKALK